MDATWFAWLHGGGSAAVAILATACTALVTPRRTYYPLLRLIFGLTACIYAATAAGDYYRPDDNPGLRIWAVGVALLMLLACVGFIMRRNRVPQWVTTDVRQLAGAEAVDFDTIDTALLNSLSLLRHGAASPETAAQFRVALREWERQQAGTRDLRAQLDARRREQAQQGGIE